VKPLAAVRASAINLVTGDGGCEHVQEGRILMHPDLHIMSHAHPHGANRKAPASVPVVTTKRKPCKRTCKTDRLGERERQNEKSGRWLGGTPASEERVVLILHPDGTGAVI